MLPVLGIIHDAPQRGQVLGAVESDAFDDGGQLVMYVMAKRVDMHQALQVQLQRQEFLANVVVELVWVFHNGGVSGGARSFGCVVLGLAGSGGGHHLLRLHDVKALFSSHSRGLCQRHGDEWCETLRWLVL